MAQGVRPGDAAAPLETAVWKAWLSTGSAWALGLLFIVSGGWKLLYPIDWAARITQMQVPGALSLPAAVGVGIAETFAGVLILVPRFRRWGAWLTGLLLVAFMVFIAVQYRTLLGEDCSCFPWIQRSVGPGFFVGDTIMLVMAYLAWRWAAPPSGKRGAALILAATTVFALAAFGVTTVQQRGIRAPEAILAGGRQVTLSQGRTYLYFFDPECNHCLEEAKRMTGYRWRGVEVIAVPTRLPQFAPQFLADSGLEAPLTNDVDLLRAKFKFQDPPYAVALEDGYQREAFIRFDETQPAARLRELGFIE